ncbi:MAG: methyltransferase domain-containing protein, partial [Verrucomicrobiota bacterium]
MSPQDIDRIASAYPKTWDRCYVRSKLKSDPLYDAVLAELKDHDLPLLDLGCGLGLTAFYLRDSGMKSDMLGLDYDERKIEGANAVVRQRQDEGFRFEHHDARQGLPEHQGHVTILDILQFF